MTEYDEPDEYEETPHECQETKAEVFTRLIESRKRGVIRRLLPICKLSNTSRYAFTRKEIEMHFGDIQKILDVVKSRFDAILDEKDVHEQYDR